MSSIEKIKKSRHYAWIILIALALIWGSSFILIKKTLVAFSASETGSLRILISFIVLFPFTWRRLSQIPLGRMKYLIIAALCGTAVPVFLFAIAQVHIPSAMTSLLNSTVPIFTLIMGAMAFKAKPTKFIFFGVAVGFVGTIIILLSSSGQITLDKNSFYGLLVILATICYALNINIIKTFLNEEDPITITLSTFVLLAPFAAVHIFGFTDVVLQLLTETRAWYSLAAVITLSIFGTVLAKILFFHLVQDTDPVFSSMVTYLIPIVAIFWGLLDGERIYLSQIMGIVLIFGAIYLVRKK